MSLVVTLPTQELLDRLAPRMPDDVEVHLWPMGGPSGLGHIDLAVMPFPMRAKGLEVLRGEQVGHVQSQSIGFDGVQTVLPQGVSFSNGVGVHEEGTAELAVMLVLASQRDLLDYVRRAGHWEQWVSPGLLGSTVLLVGVGGVGEAVRRRLEPFGVTILRNASRARSDEFGAIAGPDELPAQVTEADVIILTTPLTEETRHLFDAAMIAQMKQGALLVNVGRGPLVDTDALVEATGAGRIRAALDVVDPEPLPADHPLWHTPGVLVVPHVGGRTASMTDRVVRLVDEQIGHLLAGEPLAHQPFPPGGATSE